MSTGDRTDADAGAIGEFRDDFESVEEECRSFIRSAVRDAGAHEVIVPLSGGLDSTTTATLAVEALGCRSVNGLVLPADPSDDTNIGDAQRAAFELGIDFRTVDIQPVVDALTESMGHDYWLQAALGAPGEWADSGGSADEHQRAVGNATARARMMATYFEANRKGGLVVGTGNRTELSLGYFTKHGDGGADLLPLGHLYKTEVRGLARHLGVPDRIVDKEPTAGLREGQTDADELGATYETIDAVLRKLLDEDTSIDRIATELGVEESLVVRFAEMYRDAAHKRAVPPTPETHVS